MFTATSTCPAMKPKIDHQVLYDYACAFTAPKARSVPASQQNQLHELLTPLDQRKSENPLLWKDALH